MTPIRVVLADDQPVVRVGFRTLLGLVDDIEVVGEADDGRAAVEVVQATRPDVVLMDVRMPVVDGLEATRRIAADPALADVRVLVLTTFEVDEYVVEALRLGASGYLLKDLDPAELFTAIRSVAAGGAALAPAIVKTVVGVIGRHAPIESRRELVARLTGRERDVVSLVARGLSNEEIGRRLLMSPLTAKTHVSRAMTKVGARDRAQLVVVAYESGLVTVGAPDPREGNEPGDRH